jgi:hypothetical protein
MNDNQIEIGDFVTLDPRNRPEAWSSGHVREIRESGVVLGYGLKTTPESDRSLWFGQPEPWREIVKVERRHNVVVQSSFQSEGKEIPVTSLEYEWRPVEISFDMKGMGTQHLDADLITKLAGGREQKFSVSPDDRFPTLEAYEDAIEMVEERGIAAVEARHAALYKALNDVRTAGEKCVSREDLSEIAGLAGGALAAYKDDLRSTRTVNTSLHEQVLHLGLAAIHFSEESISFTLASPTNDSHNQKGKQAADVFEDAVETLDRWWDRGARVTEDSIEALAKAVSQTALSTFGSPGYVDFGSMMSAVARVAVDSAKTIARTGQLRSQAQPSVELVPGREKISLEAGSGLAPAWDFDPSNEEAAAALESSMAEYGIGSYPGEVGDRGVITRDLDRSQTETGVDEGYEDPGYSM